MTKNDEIKPITRQRYNQFAAIVRECWKRSKLSNLRDLIYQIYYAKEKQKDPWEFWKFVENSKLLERNQFAIIVDVSKSFQMKKLLKEFYLVSNRYIKSKQMKKQQFIDDK